MRLHENLIPGGGSNKHERMRQTIKYNHMVVSGMEKPKQGNRVGKVRGVGRACRESNALRTESRALGCRRVRETSGHLKRLRTSRQQTVGEKPRGCGISKPSESRILESRIYPRPGDILLLAFFFSPQYSHPPSSVGDPLQDS